MIKAVIVGINVYKNFPGQNLSGCINDAQDVIEYLTKTHDVAPEDITPLYDERATKAAIVGALRDMIASSDAGDHLLFHYSGHGAQIAATDVSEPDGLDEVLCPTNFDFSDRSTALVDDEIAALFATVPAGAGLTIVVDACHSGDIDRGLTKAAPTSRPRRLKPPADVAFHLGHRKTIVRRGMRTLGHGVAISACASTETAADTSFGDKANGAFTHYWLEALKKTPGASLDGLVEATAKALTTYNMHPQIDGAADMRAAAFLDVSRTLPAAQARRVVRAKRRPLALTSRSAILFETQWNATMMGLPVTLGLRVTQQGSGFVFELTPSVAGAKFAFPVPVDGNMSIPIPLSLLGQLVVDIGGWTLTGGQLDCDISARIVPSVPFVPSLTIAREHVVVPAFAGERSLIAPTSAAELQAMLELLRAAMPQLLQGGHAASREVTAQDNTPVVVRNGQIDWGPNWREDRTILVGSLGHNQLRYGEPIFFNQKGAGQVSFIRWLNDDPSDASFVCHIGNGFFGGWGSISWQVLATYGDLNIVLRDIPAAGPARPANGKMNGKTNGAAHAMPPGLPEVDPPHTDA